VRETESRAATVIRAIIVTPVIVTPIEVSAIEVPAIRVVTPHDDFARTRISSDLFFDVAHVRIALLLMPCGPLLVPI
jgi:hypothetical protein